MEDEEINTKNNYSPIKDINEEKQPECTNLLHDTDKNTNINNQKGLHLVDKKNVNYGKNKILFYSKGEPLIVLGPHCNYNHLKMS